jgi:hypothetical protein
MIEWQESETGAPRDRRLLLIATPDYQMVSESF